MLRNPNAETLESEDELFINFRKDLDIHMGCDPNRTDKKRSDFGVIMVVGVDEKGNEYGLLPGGIEVLAGGEHRYINIPAFLNPRGTGK